MLGWLRLVRPAVPALHPQARDRADAGPRGLFPPTGESSLPAFLRGQPGLTALAGVAALAAGAVLPLFRIGPTPAWDTIYAEDLSVFLIGGLSHPWHLLVPYAGYLQFLPRLIGQFTAFLPLRYAATAFAVTGALVVSGCALFVFHASAGHVRSAWLRTVLALTIVLLPVAPLEIVDSGVNTPWYLLLALLWAALWRPRTRSGLAVAAVIGFFAASSDPLAVVLAPLLLVRLCTLRRVREQAVTIGWTAGCLLQLPVMHAASAQHESRVNALAPLSRTAAFYAHDVVLPALGWHVAWQLQSLAGRNGATWIVGGLLAAAFTWAAVTGDRRVRLFAATALLLGFVFTIVAATVSSWVPVIPVTPAWEAGSRYTALPIFLLYAAAVVAVDAFVRRGRAGQRRPRHHTGAAAPLPGQGVLAVVVLVAVLAVGWVTDFQVTSHRSKAPVWAPVAARWLARCEHAAGGMVTVWPARHVSVVLPCANLRRLPAAKPPAARRGPGTGV